MTASSTRQLLRGTRILLYKPQVKDGSILNFSREKDDEDDSVLGMVFEKEDEDDSILNLATEQE